MQRVFNRSQRTFEKPVLPERLQRLNREVGIEKTKNYEYVNLVGEGFRLRVCIMRDMDGKFFATAQLAKAYRVQGGSPSGALEMLRIVLKRDLKSMQRAEKETIRAIMANN